MGLTFISYSRVDQDFAMKLANDLRQKGIEIWFDQFDIPTGALWDIEIEKALKLCSTFIVIISESSVGSKNVLDEISYAIDERKKIIPIKLAQCDIPFRLRRFQHIDFSKSYQLGFRNVLLASDNTMTPIDNQSVHQLTKAYPKRKRTLLLIFLTASVLLGMTILYKFMPVSDLLHNKKSTTTDTIDDHPKLKKAANYDDKKFIFSETQAKGMMVVAEYPLLNDAYPEYAASNFTKELEYHKYISFDRGAYISGKYAGGNNLYNAIIGTACLPYDKFNINDFAISLNFRVDSNNRRMPILYIGELCRPFGIEVSDANNIFLTFNSNQKSISASTKLELNVWQELILIYSKKWTRFYINRELVAQYKLELNEECLKLHEKEGIKVLSVNNGNATVFTGYWRDLNIYSLYH